MNLCEPQKLGFFVYLSRSSFLKLIQFGPKVEILLPWPDQAKHFCSVTYVFCGSPTQPAVPGGQQRSLRDGVEMWEELWTQVRGCTSSSHPRTPYNPKQATPPLRACLVISNEVLGFLLPESPPAMTSQTALPW